MKKRIVVMFAVWLFTTCNLLGVKAQQVRDYVVVTSKKVQADGEWMKVVEALAKDIKQPCYITTNSRENCWRSYGV